MVMVKDPDRLLSLAYAGADVRARLRLAFALDEVLADVLRTVREPMIAQIRLAWWRDQLGALSTGAAPAPEPLVIQIGRIFRPAEIATLSDLTAAWELLLQDPLGNAAIVQFSNLRGSVLASVFNSPALTTTLAFWSMADFAFHCSDAKLAAEVALMAEGSAPARLRPMPRAVRVLAGLARDDLADPVARRPASPGRMIRAFRHAVLTS